MEKAASMRGVLATQKEYRDAASAIPTLAAVASIARAKAADPSDASGYPSIAAVELQVSFGKLVLNNEPQFVMNIFPESRIFQ